MTVDLAGYITNGSLAAISNASPSVVIANMQTITLSPLTNRDTGGYAAHQETLAAV